MSPRAPRSGARKDPASPPADQVLIPPSLPFADYNVSYALANPDGLFERKVVVSPPVRGGMPLRSVPR